MNLKKIRYFNVNKKNFGNIKNVWTAYVAMDHKWRSKASICTSTTVNNCRCSYVYRKIRLENICRLLRSPPKPRMCLHPAKPVEDRCLNESVLGGKHVGSAVAWRKCRKTLSTISCDLCHYNSFKPVRMWCGLWVSDTSGLFLLWSFDFGDLRWYDIRERHYLLQSSKTGRKLPPLSRDKRRLRYF